MTSPYWDNRRKEYVSKIPRKCAKCGKQIRQSSTTGFCSMCQSKMNNRKKKNE